MPLHDYEMPHAVCPACGHTLDRAAAVDGSDTRPMPGDVTLCIRCGVFLVVTPDLGLRVMTDDEYADIPRARRLELAWLQESIRTHRRGR